MTNPILKSFLTGVYYDPNRRTIYRVTDNGTTQTHHPILTLSTFIFHEPFFSVALGPDAKDDQVAAYGTGFINSIGEQIAEMLKKSIEDPK